MTTAEPSPEVDVRTLRKPDRHPRIFAAYRDLAVGGCFVLINDHEPKHLREEFEADHPGSYRWERLRGEPGDWRIQITKLAETPVPRVLVNTADPAETGRSDATGAVWTLPPRDRDLDANIIALAPGGGIEAHHGPDLDVLVHVLAGSGRLHTEIDVVELTPGALVWLPRRSRREFSAGPDGLRYLTVHQRRQALTLEAGPARADRGHSEGGR